MTNYTSHKPDTLRVAPQKLLKLLDGLKQSEQGRALHQYLTRILSGMEQHHAEVEQAYADLFSLLLDHYAQTLASDAPLRAQIRLLQMQLTPPLSASELHAIHDYLEKHASALTQVQESSRSILNQAITQLLASFGYTAPSAAAPAGAYGLEEPEAISEELEEIPSSPSKTLEAEQRVDMVYRQHLKEKREGINKIQETLSKQVRAVIKQNEEFGGLLEVQLDALRHAGNIKDIEALRRMLVHEVSKLIQGHRDVAGKLDETHNYLRIIESDSQKLSDELTRVHLLSLTDELTGLHNRRAFLRRLEDEVSRVHRYGSPLALALIDLDGFKAINDKFGHAAGDEVLRSYSENILTIFRQYDMVARYGGEEFAVLLPNTDIEGAMRALRKVQKRATEVTFQHNDISMPLPTFSAGVALYRPGEAADDLIDRADKALYRAKRLGRNRIELAPPVEAAGKVLG